MNNIKLCVVGLGYVGIQLACEFGKYITVYGFDVNEEKLNQYKNDIDKTESVKIDSLKNIEYVSEIPNDCNVFIVCVPTPITYNNEPDYKYVISATHSIAEKLKKNDIVIYESTVCPGATRNKCIPILEHVSKLKVNEDFGVGFYTKYGDGGVDVSPIADLYKTEVYELAKALNLIESIQNAIPTDGLWDADNKTDEDQIGATYPELEKIQKEWGTKTETDYSGRDLEVYKIFSRMHKAAQHKMNPIPVSDIPEEWRD
jgi:hypothetical protein